MRHLRGCVSHYRGTCNFRRAISDVQRAKLISLPQTLILTMSSYTTELMQDDTQDIQNYFSLFKYYDDIEYMLFLYQTDFYNMMEKHDEDKWFVSHETISLNKQLLNYFIQYSLILFNTAVPKRVCRYLRRKFRFIAHNLNFAIEKTPGGFIIWNFNSPYDELLRVH